MGVWTDLEHELAEERAGDYYYPPNPPKVILSSLMLLLLLGKDVSCRFCLLSDQTVICRDQELAEGRLIIICLIRPRLLLTPAAASLERCVTVGF